MKLRKLIIILTVLIFVFALAVATVGYFGLRENKKLVITDYTVKSQKIPDSFSGFKIVQISDFHNPEDDEFVGRIEKAVENCQPDIIVITGDLIDSRNIRVDIALDFVRQLIGVAPVYFVTGNHEGRVEDYQRLRNGLEELGVNVLENECVAIENEGGRINLAGINDLTFFIKEGRGGGSLLSDWIEETEIDSTYYTVLLFHRPDYPSAFEKNEIDLVLTGHAHGGQIRLPLIGGLFSPGQGFLPEYDGGIYELDRSTMIVSRGIGNSAFPVRLNNPPEIVAVTLEK